MKITFAPRGILQIDEARIIFKNLSGAPDKYNRQGGKRSFSVKIEDEEIANALVKEGWEVRIKDGREEGDPPRMHLPVKINFNDFGPNVYLKSGNAINVLDANTVGCLDRLEIASVDLDLRPYNWTDDDGKPRRSAYLKSMHVTQEVDRFAARIDAERMQNNGYADEYMPSDEDTPW